MSLEKNWFRLFPDELARKFRQDDERILRTGEPMLKIVKLFYRQGLPDWYPTNKFPVFGKDHCAIGVMLTFRAIPAEGQL